MIALLRASTLAALAVLFAALSFVLPLALTSSGAALRWPSLAAPLVFACCGLFTALLVLLRPPRQPGPVLGFALLALLAALAPLIMLATGVRTALDASTWQAGFWSYLVALALLAVVSVRRLAGLDSGITAGAWGRWGALYGTPLVFGLWVLAFWQLLTRAFDVPQVLLPAPSLVWHELLAGFGTLASDFVQTVLHAVLIGLAAGSALGFAVGVLIDRSPFLQRGLLPLAALASTVPLIGVAPIMVMWFGFDWPSKAAVVVLVTFFPMLVNAIAGLSASGHIERDLMRSYAASPRQSLTKLYLPAALPFIFNALKINATLALIGAIVAEFFGTPTQGIGFRISTEAGRMALDMVWAEIALAAIAGMAFYGLVALAERVTTFWHPSYRT